VVQQWVALATASPKHTRLRTVALGILTVAVVALGLTVSRTRQPKPAPQGALARILQQQAEQCRRTQTGAGP
jgi:hypothetical protein